MSEKKFDPKASAARKSMPLFDGCMMYFPDALLAVSAFSLKANEKHNPGEPLHWAKHKSTDQANCVGRHLIDIGPNWDAIDPEFGELHAVALAWRSLALLQMVLEAKRAGLTVQEYIKKVKADAEQVEMEKKSPGPILKAAPQPVPTTLWYGTEPRYVSVGADGLVNLRDKFGTLVNHYVAPADLQLAIAGGMYSITPK